jgi:hypothetical protein
MIDKYVRQMVALSEVKLRLLATYLKKDRVIKCLNIFSILFLAGAIIYAARQSLFNSTYNADAIVYPFLFRHFQLHDILIPGYHSNLIFFPIYIVEAIIPYNFMTYSLVTLGLIFTTLMAWSLITSKYFGKHYTPILNAILTAFVLGSSTFVSTITGNAIRNIEFPIALAFILFTARLIASKKVTTKGKNLAFVILLLFSLSLAGDNLLTYLVVLPLLLSILIFYARGLIDKYVLLKSSVFVISSVVISFIIQRLISISGIAAYYESKNFAPHTVPQEALSLSISTALRQLMDMVGGNIFGREVTIFQAIIYLNFCLLIYGSIVYFLILKSYLNKRTTAKILNKNFVMLVLSISFFTTIAVYILADQVVRKLPNGELISRDQTRYLSMIPLLLVFSITYHLRSKLRNNKIALVLIPLLLFGLIIISAPYIKFSKHGGYASTQNVRDTIDEAIEVAKSNDISLLITGYWYGATTRFWSHDSIMAVSVANCNDAMPIFNNRLSWYKPSPNIKRSALLVDRSGKDRNYWNCTNQDIVRAYGRPERVVRLSGVDEVSGYRMKHGALQLWIYNYDLRNNILTGTFQNTMRQN